MKKEQKKEDDNEKKSETEQKTKHDPKDEQITELTNDLQRLQAEFENYRKRVEKEKKEYCKYAKNDIILELLTIIDNFELALKSIKEDNEVAKGVKMIHGQLFTLLEKEGVKQIECVGEQFNPHLHEALLTERSEEKENTIIEELQKGYMLHDKLLRHSKVKITKK